MSHPARTPAPTRHWTIGNQLRLLENGEEFFPQVFEAIAGATQEVLIETFILFEDQVGNELQRLLIAAAQRGVHVELVVDGYGSEELTPAFIAALTEAGVRFKRFDPQPRKLGFRTNIFRRLHRKTVVIDGRQAMIGGINFSAEHLREYGPESKQDYSVAVEGPVVEHVRAHFLKHNEAATRHGWRWRPWQLPWHRRAVESDSGTSGAMLVVRDNDQHRDDIEHVYRLGLRNAKQSIIIANAYFLPGFRLMRDLRRAAERGVTVKLLLQGRPDMPIVRWATTALHDELLRAGARIFEYRERPLHAKVAVIDDDWSTVGSSNLDPLSLFLNLEANLVIRDAAFAATLRANLEGLMQHQCHELSLHQARLPPLLRRLLGVLAYHLLRWLPALLNSMPARASRPVIVSAHQA
ncbi:MAG: cardiolipin synthase ClsB [Nevskia sp.]|nr:cardiolipin synthase ClsB [Nevskia sp.]